MRSVPQPGGWFSVEGLASKRNSHPLTQRVCVPAPSLHSRYLLLRYYEPVRLPYGAASRVMHSPRALAALPATPPGLPGSSTDLSPCAVPNHPGEPDGCSLPLLHRRYQASSRMADWPLPVYITRPNRVHLCYGSRVRLARLRQADCSAPRSLGYLLNGQLTGQAPFSLQDQPGLSWRSIHWFYVGATRGHEKSLRSGLVAEATWWLPATGSIVPGLSRCECTGRHVVAMLF
jgi:hypothetical protein